MNSTTKGGTEWKTTLLQEFAKPNLAKESLTWLTYQNTWSILQKHKSSILHLISYATNKWFWSWPSVLVEISTACLRSDSFIRSSKPKIWACLNPQAIAWISEQEPNKDENPHRNLPCSSQKMPPQATWLQSTPQIL